MYGGIIITGLVYWFSWGRKIYTPPVFKVNRENY